MKTRSNEYEVFISYKNSGDEGKTIDSEMARELYESLTNIGMNVFFAEVSLEETGEAQFKKAIDDALEASSILIVVGTSVENINSRWVNYEWEGFHEDILNGEKVGALFSYIDQITPPRSAPFAAKISMLRKAQFNAL